MKKEIKDLVDELLKGFKHDIEFETDDFLYWIRETYHYNGQEVSREQFQRVKDYAVKHGTLPFIKFQERLDKLSDETNGLGEYAKQLRDKDRYRNTNTYSVQNIIRYSKKYKNLDVYDFHIRIKSGFHRIKSNRVLCLTKKIKLFSINYKDYVLINGNRWLSLKNWARFIGKRCYITPKIVKMLLKLMLSGNKWIDELDEVNSINISNSSSRASESLDKAFESECGAKVPKTIRRALNNNMNDIIKLYNFIEPNQIHYLTNFIKRNHETIDNVLKLNDYGLRGMCGPVLIIYLYYLSRDNRLIDKHDIVNDYLIMIENEPEKINLNISSYKTIKSKHDELSNRILERARAKGRLRVSKVYPKLSSIPGVVDVELIKSVDRLNTESLVLHHCVHTYKSLINTGDCAIYSLVYRDERYTLEVRAHKKLEPVDKLDKNEGAEAEYKLQVNQLKGRYNCNPPKSMKKYIQMMCDNHELILPDSGIVFEDKVNKKEPKNTHSTTVVKQIGEDILKDFIKIAVKEKEDLPF
jgi:hypothetical protein